MSLRCKSLLILILTGFSVLTLPSLVSACTYEATISGSHLDFTITSDVDKLSVIQYVRMSGSALVTKLYSADIGTPWTYLDDLCNVFVSYPIACRQNRGGGLGSGAYWQWSTSGFAPYHPLPGGVWGLDFDIPPTYESLGIEYGTTGGGEAWKYCTRNISPPPPQLTVIKHVVNDSGGAAVAGDFTMSVTGTNVSNSSFAGSESGTIVTLDAGSYFVDENASTGYTNTLGPNCSGTIAAGEVKICTITNDDIPPHPVTKVIFAPGFGGSWNADAILNCKTDGYTGSWILAPFAKSTYKPLLDALNSSGWDTKEFYYDWRKQIPTNGNSFSDFINTNSVSNEKVNLVGHSMGGLVERAYLESYGKTKTNSYYSAGSPHKGVVQSYPAWSGGNILNDNLTANIAATLLMHRCPGFFQNPRQVIQNKIPSIQNVLPVFDYLKNFQTSLLKPVSSMLAKNNWLPGDETSTFNGVRIGTLSGNGFQTLRYIRTRNPNASDTSQGNWFDGKPVAQEKTSEGDGTVLTDSSQLSVASINDVINQNHSGLVASEEGISKILNFLGTPVVRIFKFISTAAASNPINNSIYIEPNSALIIVGYPGNFWVKDPNNNVSPSDNGMISFMNPVSGNYELQIIPQVDDTLIIVAQFLPNGQTLYKEYHFKGLSPKTEEFRFDLQHPTEDILKHKTGYKDFHFPWWKRFWKFPFRR